MDPEWAEEVPQSDPRLPGKGSGSLMQNASKARVAGRRPGERTEERQGEGPALETLPPGPASQLGALGGLRGLPHVCPLLHGVLQGLGLLLVHLNIVHLLVRSDG